MNSSRNKKLLACFLTALGLSANSLNVSAKNSQFMSNMKFELNKLTNSKFFGGTKIKEKAGLDILLEESEELYNSFDEDNLTNNNVKKFNFNNDEEAYNKFFELCSRLYDKSTEIINHRISKRYNSLLCTSLGQILNDYPLKENNNEVNYEVNYENMNAWLLKIVGSREDSGIKWGKFSVGSIIQKIANNLFSININNLAQNLEEKRREREKENSNNLLIKVKDKNEEVKPESKEEKINRIIKNNFKITVDSLIFNFKLKDDKFNDFKKQVEDIDNNGIIKMNENSGLFNDLSVKDLPYLKFSHLCSTSTKFDGGRLAELLFKRLDEINNKIKFTVDFNKKDKKEPVIIIEKSLI